MNKYKKNIINMIFENLQADVYEKDVEDYLLKYPGDTDIITVKAYINLLKDKIDDAIKILKFVLRKNPICVDAFFLIGQAYNEVENFYDALLSLGKARILAAFFKIEEKSEFIFFSDEICAELLINIIDDTTNAMSALEKEKIIEVNNLLKDFKERLDNHFDFFEDIVRAKREIIGHNFSNTINDIRFCALYDTCNYNMDDDSCVKNLRVFKTEMLKQFECGNNICFNLAKESLVPILVKEKNTNISIKEDDNNKVTIHVYDNMHFNYYKINSGNVKIDSDKELVVAEPIPLSHNQNNKRLVISLFLDGLSQVAINEYGLQNMMPNTYSFFSKGMICQNAFTSSDWTYPSLSSLISGLSVPNHMMIHPNINIKFPNEQKLLFEYFKEAGYHTTVLSGDWRSTCATYDSIRGVDRYIAKHQNCGFRTEDVISNAIDSIETFSDMDQYVWIGTGDLHDIADELNIPSCIQKSMSLEDFSIGKKSRTSVKQKYNPNKIKMYARMAKYIDSKLKNLYDYIEKNYSDNEFVITLFGDHGQAYMVKSEEHHLARGLSNIGFMTRGGGVSGVSDEYINIVDYTNIITKLAGIENVDIKSDGKLPETFGGNMKSKFAITETIHPGDPYMVAIHSSKYLFYLESSSNVLNNDKFDLSSYNVKLLDSKGYEIFDEDIVNEFIEYIFERTKYIRIY